MITALFELDTRLFYLINHLPHPYWADSIALFFSAVGGYGVVWLILGGLVYIPGEIKHRAFWLDISAGLLVSTILVEFIFKPLFGRLRPDELLGAIVVGDNCCSYSFPSGHATVAFTMATILAQKEPRFRGVWYAIALCISVSRVYLGRHYPMDILAGAVLGYVLGISILKLIRQLLPDKAEQLRSGRHRKQ